LTVEALTTEQTTAFDPNDLPTARRYCEVLVEHAERFQEEIGSDYVPDVPRARFVLVQRSRLTGLYWLDFGDTLQEAIDSHDADEYPEDWPIEYALDLDTGERYHVAGVRTETSMELDD